MLVRIETPYQQRNGEIVSLAGTCPENPYASVLFGLCPAPEARRDQGYLVAAPGKPAEYLGQVYLRASGEGFAMSIQLTSRIFMVVSFRRRSERTRFPRESSHESGGCSKECIGNNR